MFIKEFHYILRTNDSSCTGYVVQKVIEQKIFPLALEPMLERHRESLLLAIKYGLRQSAAHCLFENVLCVLAVKFQLRRYRSYKLCQLMIEKRYARFQ